MVKATLQKARDAAQRLQEGRHAQIDVYAAAIPDFPFKPGVHVNYEATVLRMKDGLPKLKDFPKELGGSGEQIAE